MAQNIIGIDVGGTKILACLVDDNGAVAARAKVSSPTDSADALMAAVKLAVRDVTAKAGLTLDDVAAIGAGVPGPVDAGGTCIWAPNCPLSGVEVAALLRAEFGVPVAVGNDVNVGTFGERAYGAGRGFDNVFGMFVGTGIGGGLVVNGHVVIGDHCLGAEVGHIIVDYQAALRGDEGGGEFEYLASRLGIERAIRAAIAARRETVVKDRLGKGSDRIKSGLLKDALDAEDEVVTQVLTEAARIIGLAAVTVIYLCDPEVLIFGGGVIEACGEFMMPLIRATIDHHIVAAGKGQNLRLVVSELGDDAVALGAAALARDLLAPDDEDSGADDDAEDGYPRVAAMEFGSVLVNGQVQRRDLVVRANGEVKRRRKELSREVHGTAHEVSADEIKYVCKGRPEVLVMGQGYDGLVTLSRDAARWLAKKGIRAVVAATPEAAEAFNDESGRKALLLHVGC
jgi:glucokinase